MMARIFLLALSLVLWGCSSRHDLENYGDITQSPGGIALVDPNEHAGGFARNQCLVCHNAALSIHRSKGSVIGDVDELNRLIRENGEAAYCLTCHGPNQ